MHIPCLRLLLPQLCRAGTQIAQGECLQKCIQLIPLWALQVEKRHAVRLYYGTKNESYTAFKHLIPEWQDMGVTVKHVYSDEDRGYVQQVFKEVSFTSCLQESHGIGHGIVS